MKKLYYASRDGANITVLYYEADGNAPLLLEVHGGGFKYGCAADDENMCLRLSKENGVNVASVDYRLAPAVKYPVATFDCVDALRGLVADKSLRFDRQKIALIGHSAGANLAVGACHELKNEINIGGQILFYPFLDVTQNKRKYVFTSFTRTQLRLTNNAYFPDRKRREEFTASPIKGTEQDFKRLPPTLIFTAGIDVLKPDGEQFASALRSSGVPCTHVHEELARHGYFEVVPNGNINKWWWVSKKSKAEQREAYERAHAHINKFLKEIKLI